VRGLGLEEWLGRISTCGASCNDRVQMSAKFIACVTVII